MPAESFSQHMIFTSETRAYIQPKKLTRVWWSQFSTEETRFHVPKALCSMTKQSSTFSPYARKDQGFTSAESELFTLRR